MIDFAADTAAIFADGLGDDATYTPVGGSPAAVRVIRRQPDGESGFASVRTTSPSATFLIAVAAVAAPAAGDAILCGGVSYMVQGVPVRDERHLRWTVEAYPT